MVVYSPPAVMAVYWPSGAPVCPRLSPQHVMVLSVRRAQEWRLPAVMALYWPSGASASPELFRPQHVMVLSVRRAQEWP